MWSLWLAAAWAGVQVPVQGLLTGADGAPVEGTRALSVGLSPNADGSGPVWTDEIVAQLTGGAFSVVLGADDDLPATVFKNNPSLYLVVGLSGQPAATPVRLGAAPRAAYADLAGAATTAANATQFDGRSLSEFVLDGDDIPWSDLILTAAPALIRDGLAAGTGVSVSGNQVSWAYTPGTGLRLNGSSLEARFSDFDGRYAQLAAGGGLSLTSSVRVGADGAECTTANRGAIRFDGTSFQGCTPSGWSALASGGSGSTPATGNGSSSSNPAASCLAAFNAGSTTSGAHWIDPDGSGPVAPYEEYCLHSQHSGGWAVIMNLDTDDTTRRDWTDTTFWQGSGTVGAAAGALTGDHKSPGYLYETGSELMICAHNEGTVYGCAVYDFAGTYGSQTFNALMNLGFDTTITGSKKATSGTVGTFGRYRNGGDSFVDHSNPVIVNSRFNPLDGTNYTRIGTNFTSACNLFDCNGHNYGGLGGQHSRSTWGTLYEAAAVHQYCPTRGAYGTNGTTLAGFANNAFNSGSACSEGSADAAPVDVAILRRASLATAATYPGASIGTATLSCNAAKAGGATANGAYWIDPDGTGPIQPYQQHCNLTDHGGGWGLVINLDTNDLARRDWQDTQFWTGSGVHGSATAALVDDHKNAAFQYQVGGEIMICAHNEGANYGCAAYDLLSGYTNTTFMSLMALSNTTITAARKAVTGSVGTFGRARNGGDPFIDRAEALIVNSTYSPVDAANFTRIGTNYAGACAAITCNGHNFGGLGGQHYRGSWGTLYEAAALNGYCDTQGGYGTNGTGYNGYNAFDGYGFSGGCSGVSRLAPVDVSIYRR